MSDAVSEALAKILTALNDPLRQEADDNMNGLIGEFRGIEREWRKALEPGLLHAALKRLGAEIGTQEDLLSDEAASAFAAGGDFRRFVGKSGRLMKIRLTIEQENP